MTEQSYRWVVLAGCWSLYFVFGLSISGLAPVVSDISRDLGLSASAMGTVLGSWQFVYIFLAIPVGLALQRFGPGRMLVLAAAVIALSGFLRALADDHASLLLAVAMFGIGGPIISAGVPQTVARWFSGRQRGIAMGIYITGPPAAAIVTYASSQSILVPLTGSWRGVLMIWAAAAATAGACWLAIWWRGRALLDRPAAPGTASAQRFRLADAAPIMTDPRTWILLATGIGVFVIDHGLRNWLPEILRAAGLSAETAGYYATIPVVCGVVGALTVPSVAIHQRRIQVLMCLFAAACAGCLMMLSPATALLVPGLAMVGFASGAMMTVTLLTLIEQPYVGPERAGIAGGIYFSFAEIGGVAGPVMIGSLRDYTGTFDLALTVLAGVGAALVVLAGLLLARSPRPGAPST